MTDHKVEDIKGHLKETIGDITGDKGLQLEGKLDQAVASAKKHIDKAADKLEDAVDRKDRVDAEGVKPKA